MPGATPNYSIAYPLAGENIVRQQLQDLATTADTAVHQAVLDAAAAASPYAASAASSAAVAAATPLMFAFLLGGA